LMQSMLPFNQRILHWLTDSKESNHRFCWLSLLYIAVQEYLILYLLLSSNEKTTVQPGTRFHKQSHKSVNVQLYLLTLQPLSIMTTTQRGWPSFLVGSESDSHFFPKKNQWNMKHHSKYLP
jgi:hypothetical protein